MVKIWSWDLGFKTLAFAFAEIFEGDSIQMNIDCGRGRKHSSSKFKLNLLYFGVVDTLGQNVRDVFGVEKLKRVIFAIEELHQKYGRPDCALIEIQPEISPTFAICGLLMMYYEQKNITYFTVDPRLKNKIFAEDKTLAMVRNLVSNNYTARKVHSVHNLTYLESKIGKTVRKNRRDFADALNQLIAWYLLDYKPWIDNVLSQK